MKNYLIDTHAHIDMLNNIEEALEQMKILNVLKAVIPAVEIKTQDKIVDLINQYDNLYGMVGIFPTEAKTFNDSYLEKFRQLKNNPKIVAVGEIGLDYYWDKSFVDKQKDIFIKQIKLANELELPIVVHDREAHKDTYDILKEYNKTSKVLFHCFSGSVEFMHECVKENWLIAIGGVVTFKNAVKLKDVAKDIPLTHLVLETDTPYLTPVPFRGKENQPAYVKYVAEEIAKIRDMDVNEIIDITTENAERFFGI